MNKNKLISIIIKKQTYKDAKAYLSDICNLKEQAVKYSVQAIKEILSTEYNAEAKLYAVRYLKDAFEKANPSFISQIEKEILPLLTNIVSEENDDKTILKYAGSSFTKAEELTKFKSIISSFFRMAKECIIKWAEWIPEENRKFVQALNDLKRKKISLQFQFKYFRPENQQLFRQYGEKNGLKLSKQSTKALPTPKPAQKKQKDPLIQQIQKNLAKLKAANNQEEILKIQNDFNEAINNYLEYSEDFQQQFMQKAFDQFQKIKLQVSDKIKAKKISNKIEIQKVQNAAPKITQKQKIALVPKDKSKENNIKKDEPAKKNIKQSSLKQMQAQKSSLDIQSKKSMDSSKSKQVKQVKKIIINQPEPVIKILEPKIEIKNIEKVKQQKPIQKQQKISSNKFVSNSSQRQNKDKKQIEKQKNNQIKSNKKGPIIFQQLQEQFQNKNIKSKPTDKSQQKKNSQTNRRLQFQQNNHQKPKVTAFDVINHQKVKKQVQQKYEDRIDFSQEEDSQLSEQMNEQKGNGFKKIKNLSPILEQSFQKQTNKKIIQKSELSSKSSKSPNRSDIQQAFTINKQKKGVITHKFMQQNAILKQKLERLQVEFQRQKKQKNLLLRQKKSIQTQLISKRQLQQKLNNKIKSSIPIQDYNKLKKEIDKLNKIREQHQQENNKLRQKNTQLQEKVNQLINVNKYNHQKVVQKNSQKDNQKSNSRVQNVSPRYNNRTKQQFLEIKVQQNMESGIKNVKNSQLSKQEIDPDYINNLTHVNNIHAWLNKNNILLFKKNILKQSQIFYRDDYLTILSRIEVYTQNNEQFIALKLTFQFKGLKQVNPSIKYKNCQELDLWNKPLTGQQLVYNQELAIRLHINPLKIMKAELKIIQTLNNTFLLPFIYYNFLREQEFSNDEFQDIYSLKAEHLIKSKIVQWNSDIIKDRTDFQHLFKFSISTSEKLRFCLSEGINDQVFMGQLQFLRNNKIIIKMLPIPHTESMVNKSKQLIQNFIFLFS